MKNPTIVVHGGAGTILKSEMNEAKEKAYNDGLRSAIDHGYAILDKGGSAVDAVVSAIQQLEDNPLFNAGKGAVFNAQGGHEMDASIMEGKDREAGAIAAIPNLRNPIALANDVMNHSDHVLLIGDGARDFGELRGAKFESDEYFYDAYRFDQWNKIKDTDSFQLDHTKKEKKYLGTVGAVALDMDGNIAAGTSTGGMTNKKFGRVGDSAIIGSGTYADNRTCAISCTGTGEYFMRGVTAYDVSCLMMYKGLSLQEATAVAIQDHLTELGGDGGLIAVDVQGNISMEFNCEGMYRAYRNAKESVVKIYRN